MLFVDALVVLWHIPDLFMKQTLITGWCLLCGFCAAGAQESPWPAVKPFILQADIGVVSPRDMAYADRLGLSLGGGAGIRFGRGFSILLSAHYNGIPHDKHPVESLVNHPDSITPKVKTHSDFSFRVTTVALEGRFRFQHNPREPSAYLLGGVNYSSRTQLEIIVSLPTQAETTTLPEKSDESIGYSLGLGVDWPIQRDKTALFAELRFSKGVLQINASDINPYFLALRAGVQVNF